MSGASSPLRAGVSRVDITPRHLPAIVNGDFFERRISIIDDPLSVRALVLADADTKIAFAVVDSCMLPAELIDQVKKLVFKAIGLPPNRIMISATHCHSAPSVRDIFATGIDHDYAAWLPGRITEAICRAHEGLQPASLGYAEDADPENVFCRRFIMQEGSAWTENPAFTGSSGDIAQMNPEGKLESVVCPTGRPDPTVSILGILDEKRLPLAVLGNYSTHYVGADHISADYFAVFADQMAMMPGADDRFLAIMSNGTSGDANSIDFRNPERRYDRFTVGRSVAQAGMRAFERIRFSSDISIDMLEKELELGVRKPSKEQVELAQEHWKQIQDNVPKDREDVYARETILLADYADTVTVKLQAIRIGKLGIVAIPCEIFSSTGREIRAVSPMEQTFVISHANGSFGYLPPEEAFFFGGYTTWRARTSMLETGAERKIRLTAIQMLEQLSTL